MTLTDWPNSEACCIRNAYEDVAHSRTCNNYRTPPSSPRAGRSTVSAAGDPMTPPDPYLCCGHLAGHDGPHETESWVDVSRLAQALGNTILSIDHDPIDFYAEKIAAEYTRLSVKQAPGQQRVHATMCFDPECYQCADQGGLPGVTCDYGDPPCELIVGHEGIHQAGSVK